jgi:uncharacterized lipoprotein YajG
MKTKAQLLLATAVVVLAACAPTQYIISTTSGQMITAYGKPESDLATGMLKYRDSEGKQAMIKLSEVKQVMER